MKELVLIRHAKSSWKDTSLNDFDRPINKRGKNDAPKIAKFLRKMIVNSPDLIISSPSKRTKLTLEFFLKEFDLEKSKDDNIIFEESIYEAPYTNLLKVIKNINENKNIVFLFGHNPGLNDLTNYLIGNFKENIPTSGILKINFDINLWSEIEENSGKLEFFKYPKILDI